MFALLRQQPPSFFLIFMLEIWERFGFYTVQGILVLYFVRTLGMSQVEAYDVFGVFSALIYGSIPIGGYLGDHWVGTKRIIVIGLVVLAIGYILLAWQIPHTLYSALGLICVGSALFKSNPSVLLAHCYKRNPKQLHEGFTLYYMAINIGSLGSFILGPYMADHFGYGYAYLLSALGVLIGLGNFWWQRNLLQQIKTTTDNYTLSLLQWTGFLIGIVIATATAVYLLQHAKLAQRSILGLVACFLAFYFHYMTGVDAKTRSRMWVALILMIEAIVFFTLYQQMPTSINVFAVSHVYPRLWGVSFDPQSFQILNPLWIMVMSVPVASVYNVCQKRGFMMTVPYKFAIGMLFCSLSFAILAAAHLGADTAAMLSPWWLVASYLCQSLGEILVSALGVAMVAELVPDTIMGFVMGMWFLATSLAGFTGAKVAALTAIPKGMEPGLSSLLQYTHVFSNIAVMTFVAAILMGILALFLTRLIRE